MSEQKEVRGYKVFNPDWTCRGFQYKVGENYELNETPIACERGYHFCKRLIDCYDYYTFSPENKVAEVTAYGEIDTKENKQCTNKIRIEREISWKEVLNTVNTGKDCTGIGNSGNENSGNYNSCDENSGNHNSGNENSGNHNSGDENSGNYNSGDWNISNYNNGCFNTQPAKIFMFNKLSSWTAREWKNSKARYILKYYVREGATKWIDTSNMTEEEKKQHTEWKTIGGYSKELSQEEIFQEQQKNWNALDSEEKEIVMSIPNFDKEIFKEITGIDVDK